MAIKLGKPNFFGVAILCAIALTLSFFVDMPALADTLLPQVTSTPTLGSKITLEKEPTSAPTSSSTPSVISQITITTPTKHPVIYKVPKNPATQQELTPQEIAQKLSAVIFHRGFAAKALEYRRLGLQGPLMQYIIMEQLVGPPYRVFSSRLGRTEECTEQEREWGGARSNNVTMDKGAFCEIQDSIATGTTFDHDLNPDTPPIQATEDWFLHVIPFRSLESYRIVRNGGGGKAYYPNPGNKDWQEYFIARLLREMTGTPNHPKSGMDGIYLDNLELSWNKVLRDMCKPTLPENCQSQLEEYQSSETYGDAVFEFIKRIHNALHTNDNNFPLWANMIEGGPWNSNSEWDRFEPYLEGGFLEAFALNWGNGYFSPNTIENQLKQAQRWLEKGNYYIAGAPGNSTNRDEQAGFALATDLLIADGNKAYFSYSDRSNLYDYWWEYPEYYYNFGNPIESYQQVSDNPKVLRRSFECGSVEVDLTNKVPTFNYTPCNANPS
jgi:hypothetical protein